MRLNRWILITLVLALGALAACSPEAETTDLPALLSPEETQTMLDENDNVVLLDVRTPEEWENDGHAPDAILLPLQELEARIGELNTDDTIIVVCRSGNRSQTASAYLRDNGFSAVSEVEGGMRNWASAGLPVE